MAELHKTSRIEGGIDAIVLGAAPDALAAAALLARGGLHVILVDDVETGRFDRREFAAGYFASPGDPLVSCLDARVVEALDLYRRGLRFAARRLETQVRFSDGAILNFPGDPALCGEAIAEFSAVDADSFALWFEAERKAARRLADWFAGDDAPLPEGEFAEKIASSVTSMIAGRFAEARLDDYLGAEAALGAALRPAEPFSYLALLRRLAGETAGLQGAVGFVDGGGRGVETVLRRVCEASSVAFRQTAPVKSVIIEWDRVAGVAFADGAQIRAPIVVTAQPAKDAFIEHIGRDKLDIEFTRRLELPASDLVSLRAHLAVNGPIGDAHVAANLARRFLLAPSPLDTERAFRSVKAGEAPLTPIAEMVFPSAFDSSLAPEGCSTASLVIHPVADRSLTDDAWRSAAVDCARRTFARMAEGADIAAVHVEETLAAAPAVAAAIEQRDRLTGACGVEGYFYCGPQAQNCRGLDLSAGRRAAERAKDYFRKGGRG